MQTRTRVKDGVTTVEVVDPSDGTTVRTETVGEGEQFVVTTTTATSPADLQFGEVEAIPEAEAEAPTEGNATEGGSEPTTSACTEKPLYTVQADPIPEGFVPSGLATPEDVVLFHYEGDTAGEAHTAEVGEGVTLYA